ncbi:2'-5' RNA ligase family protein [Bradyrhizobium liaoningense]|uniref:2'-5' RNA ligase family protein n=1 Tax=Bradyrhizobium liaoningense TaxID=43992 RepID=UPI002012C6A7|nr:2'-5' RNA ligase family protein [Bradyrhizobium liaoningense]
MPCPEDTAFLASLIGELATRFGTPNFAPHLTLRGDTDATFERLHDDVQAAAAASQPFAEPITTVETTEAFFRAFYVRFAVSVQLDRLKRRLDPQGTECFMPHVSLLYGNLPEEVKAPAAAEFSQRLAGRTITFDRISVVRSGQDIPIADWTIQAPVPLGR